VHFLYSPKPCLNFEYNIVLEKAQVIGNFKSMDVFTTTAELLVKSGAADGMCMGPQNFTKSKNCPKYPSCKIICLSVDLDRSKT